MKAEEPAAVWAPAEHLLALAVEYLSHISYVTSVVNTDEKTAKQIPRPEPIHRPWMKQEPTSRRHGPRPRIGPPLNPADWGGAPMDTTAVEVKPE